MNKLPLAYRVNLNQLLLIEASAGTGKTFTLVRLMARHILWDGYRIEQVLAVTFSKLATAELKQRLHAFLNQVAEFCKNPVSDNDIEFLFSEKPDTVTEFMLLERLARALQNIDRAAVFTIHSFCFQLLQEFALSFELNIPAPALIDNDQDYRNRVCEEFWRATCVDANHAKLLSTTFKDTNGLLNALNSILTNAKLKPDRQCVNQPNTASDLKQLQDAFFTHGEKAKQLLLESYHSDILNKTYYSVDKIHAFFQALDLFLNNPSEASAPDLANYSYSTIKVKKDHERPNSPLFIAIEIWNRHVQDIEKHQECITINLHHDLKSFATSRLRELKHQDNVLSFDDVIHLVANAFIRGDAKCFELLSKIRQRYPVALVDEFQDTDDQQWQIFNCLYVKHDKVSLCLVGDPKQAIYGFRGGDIHTYIRVLQQADCVESLPENFRTNQSLLDSIASVFNRSDTPFYLEEIPFPPVLAGRCGAQLIHSNNTLASPLSCISYTPETDKTVSVEQSRQFFAEQCARSIASLLQDAQTGLLSVHENSTARALLASDIAVLVSNHVQADVIQKALRACGIRSVYVSRDSIFNSYAAIDVFNVLHYLYNINSHSAEHTARSGILIQSYQQLFNLEFNAAHFSVLLEQNGPLSALQSTVSNIAPALLLKENGAQELGFYMHVLECLQEQFYVNNNVALLLSWLHAKLNEPRSDSDDSAYNPRLESSGAQVRILTVHKSKGLEFGYVFMPFTGIRSSFKPNFSRYFDDERCLLIHKKFADDRTLVLAQREHLAEQLRLLYVGMTRAKFALCVSFGFVNDIQKSALGYLFSLPAKPYLHDIKNALLNLQQEPIFNSLYFTHQVTPLIQTKPLADDFRSQDSWSIHSFSSLHRGIEPVEKHSSYEEIQDSSLVVNSPFKGKNYGNALHFVLETTHWQDWNVASEQLNTIHFASCEFALTRFGYSSDLAQQGALQLAQLVHSTLHAVLPENSRLIDIPLHHLKHEMEFHLSVAQANTTQLLNILHQYNYCLHRNQLGFSSHLNGLLNGKIDLLYLQNERYFIVDYKSNMLDAYGQTALHNAIRTNEYDLQYILYTLALHRYLKLKLGAFYSYSKHIGGIRYLFSRGLEANQGVYIDLPPHVMIEAIDVLFSPSVETTYA